MPEGIVYLDGARLRRCLLAGLQQLADEREHLNRINVFPVPDGDTGNNLAHTALAAYPVLTQDSAAGAGTTLALVANAMLDAAQGNSGALLAQFMQGLASSIGNRERIDTAELASALKNAAAATRNALDKPREGTIISVIDASAQAAEAAAASHDFKVVLAAMLQSAQVALAATTEQLAELRKAGVVDAGGAGYCAILQGCVDYLSGGSIRARQPVAIATEGLSEAHAQMAATGQFEFRYCTECMITGANLQPAQLRNALQMLGNSLVIAGSDSRLRIHIHTNNPEQIFRRAADFGAIEKTKADDMLGQARSLRRGNRSVAIATDSAADIPADLIAALNIHVVPLRILFGTASFLDKIGMSSTEFAEELRRNPDRPGTSQPTQGDLRRMYEFLVTHSADVLSINLSSALSGTYQAACAAAAAVDGGERIQVIDSANVSVGQGLIVKRAAERAAAGSSGEELLAAVREDIVRVRTFALVTDFSNAVRSGRLNPAVKHIADWSHLTPVLRNTRAGKIGIHGFIPGRFRLAERFAGYISRAVGQGQWEIAIAHSSATSEQADILQAELTRRLGAGTNIWRTEIGAALGVHAGMTALGVAVAHSSL